MTDDSASASLDWAEQFTRSVVQEIRRRRDAKGWTVARLAERCSELGYPIKRTTFSNLEGGLRKSIGLAELVVIAAALELPPALLAVPLGQTETVEVLPGQEVGQWTAFKWFCGQSGAGRGHLAPFVEHAEWATEVLAATANVARCKSWVGEAESDAERQRLTEQMELSEKLVHSAERALLESRARIAGAGRVPPRLPAELAYLTDTTPDDLPTVRGQVTTAPW